jgi:hypothetical protein
MRSNIEAAGIGTDSIRLQSGFEPGWRPVRVPPHQLHMRCCSLHYRGSIITLQRELNASNFGFFRRLPYIERSSSL